LAAGVALARALRRAGLEKHRLKWPNDILVDGRKLAGILVEASGEANGPCNAIIGIGLNIELDAACGELIDQPWTDLHTHLHVPPRRNELAGLLLDELIGSCIRYQHQGLEPFLPEWRAWDGFLGQEVELISADRRVAGIYSGLDARGGLILHGREGLSTFYAGEVSLRKKAHG
jgi:BirA family biotin operon repressor/biotin-[acetyl-CoA-carboxylase] ligase